MRLVILAFAVGLALLAVPAPAQAVLCNVERAVEDPVGYTYCQFGCVLSAVERLDPFIVCPL